MEERERTEGHTWDDVERSLEAEHAQPSDLPPRTEGEQPPNGHMHGTHDGHGPRPRVGRGRLTVYLLLTVLLNIVLAVFGLFILGVSVEAVKEMLSAGSIESMPRLILLVLIMISPLLLTILGNRLLYCGMRGRGRFPRGIWLFAVVLVLLVQAGTFYVAFTAGAVPALESFEVQSFTTAEY